MKKLLFILSISILVSCINICNAQWQLTDNSIVGKYIASMAARGNKVFAGTSDGLYMSTDKGNHWKAINHGLPHKEIWAIAAGDTNMIVGTWGGGLFLSNATDTSWTFSGVDLSSIDDIMIDGDNIYAGSYGEGISLSTDGGKNWNKIVTGLSEHYVHAIVKSKTNIIAGTSSGIFSSSNFGQNWTSIDSGITNSTDIRGMIAKDTIVFAGTSGLGIYRSEDSGVSWDSISTGPSYSEVWCFAISGTNIFAGTYGGGVFLSTDNGFHWSEINEGFPNDDYVLSVMSICISEGYLYAGTKTGGVWKRSISEILGVKELTINNGQMTIYPNPVNSSLFVSFSLLAKSPVNISIYDMIGRKVSTLVDEVKDKGEHSIKYNAEELRSGIYFVRLSSNNDSEVVKFVKN
jgi:hypothetical protein